MPGKVKVKIISGKNLPIMDRSNDTTDAYVEIKLGNITYKTEVCRRTLHPRWNTDWYRFELDDSELQDEPLQIRLMDHDTYSANDAIGKVYLNLNPLLLPAAGQIAVGDSNSHHEISGWIPVYDTMHGIRGEVNVTVKVEVFSDFNKFRQSSCGIKFFYSQCIPQGYQVKVINGFVEELIVDDDPEYQWIDKIRTPRASNEARQTLFFKLSGELQRKIGVKAVNLGGNAVIGYKQCFDLEGESGIVARGIGTAVTLVKAVLLPNPVIESREEHAEKYLKFVGDGKRFSLGSAVHFFHNTFQLPSPAFAKHMPKKLSQRLYTSLDSGNISSISSPSVFQDDSTVRVLLNQEDKRKEPGESTISRRFQKFRHSQKSLSKKMTALRAKFGDSFGEQTESTKVGNKKNQFKRTASDSGAMAEILARSVFHATNSLSCILESQGHTKIEDTMESLKPLSNLLNKTESEKSVEESSDISDSSSETSSSDWDYDDSEKNDVETISNIVSNVEKLQRRGNRDNLKKQYSLPTLPLKGISTESMDTISEIDDQNYKNKNQHDGLSVINEDDSVFLKPEFPQLLLDINKKIVHTQYNQQKKALLMETSFDSHTNKKQHSDVSGKNYFSEFPRDHRNFQNIDLMTPYGEFSKTVENPDNLLIAPIENANQKENSLVKSAMQTMLLERLNCMDVATPPVTPKISSETQQDSFTFDGSGENQTNSKDLVQTALETILCEKANTIEASVHFPVKAQIPNVENSDAQLENSTITKNLAPITFNNAEISNKQLATSLNKIEHLDNASTHRDDFVFDESADKQISSKDLVETALKTMLFDAAKESMFYLPVTQIENTDIIESTSKENIDRQVAKFTEIIAPINLHEIKISDNYLVNSAIKTMHLPSKPSTNTDTIATSVKEPTKITASVTLDGSDISEDPLMSSATEFTVLTEDFFKNKAKLSSPTILNIENYHHQDSFTFDENVDKKISSKEFIDTAIKTVLIDKVNTAECVVEIPNRFAKSHLKRENSNIEIFGKEPIQVPNKVHYEHQDSFNFDKNVDKCIDSKGLIETALKTVLMDKVNTAESVVEIPHVTKFPKKLDQAHILNVSQNYKHQDCFTFDENVDKQIYSKGLIETALQTVLMDKANTAESVAEIPSVFAKISPDLIQASDLNRSQNYEHQDSFTFDENVDKRINSKGLIETALKTVLMDKINTAESVVDIPPIVTEFPCKVEAKYELSNNHLVNTATKTKPVDELDTAGSPVFADLCVLDCQTSLANNSQFKVCKNNPENKKNSFVQLLFDNNTNILSQTHDSFNKNKTVANSFSKPEDIIEKNNLVVVKKNSKFSDIIDNTFVDNSVIKDFSDLNHTEENVSKICEKVIENSVIFKNNTINNVLIAPLNTVDLNSEPRKMLKSAMQLILLDKFNTMGVSTPPASPIVLDNAKEFNLPEICINDAKTAYCGSDRKKPHKPLIKKAFSAINLDSYSKQDFTDETDTFSCFSDTDLHKPSTQKQILKKKRKFGFVKLKFNKGSVKRLKKENIEDISELKNNLNSATCAERRSVSAANLRSYLKQEADFNNRSDTFSCFSENDFSVSTTEKQELKKKRKFGFLRLNFGKGFRIEKIPNTVNVLSPHKRSISESFSSTSFDLNDGNDAISSFSETDLHEPRTKNQVLNLKRKFSFFNLKFNKGQKERKFDDVFEVKEPQRNIFFKMFHPKHEEMNKIDTQTQTSTEFISETSSPAFSESSNNKVISKIQSLYMSNKYSDNLTNTLEQDLSKFPNVSNTGYTDLHPHISNAPLITNPACVTPNRQNSSPVHHHEANGCSTSQQKGEKKECSPDRTPGKHSYSPIKLNTSAVLHRRSSDSDLSITPKGNSLTGSDKSGGHAAAMHMKNHYIRRNGPQDNFEMINEYPFLTMNSFPSSFIIHLGSSVSSKSVKVLERISNIDEPESRDSWWSEIRMEIRAHARSLNCNAVLGYTEFASIYEDVCVLSASGTAAVVDFNSLGCTAVDEDRDQRNADGGKKTIYESPEHNSNQNVSCKISHLPYDDQNVPANAKVSKCPMCSRGRVPEVLMVTIEPPNNLPSVGKGCFIECHVSRPLRDLKGESIAREISEGLPFLEYELHRLLVNKLKIKGMNAIFSLKIRYSMGERMLMAIASGTAIYLSSLHAPALPVLVSDRVSDEKIVAGLQEMLIETIKKNREIYEINDDFMGKLTDEDLEDTQAALDLAYGNKDCSVLEMDDPEDAEVVTLLMEDKVPDGFHVVNTESVPGLEDLEIVKNLQMFIQIYRAKISQHHNLQKHFNRLLQSVYFKLRRMVPCALCDLQFRVDIPDSDEIQLCIIGMALGLGKKAKKRTPLLTKKSEDDLIFNLDDDTPQDTPNHGLRSNSTSLKFRPGKSPSKIRTQSMSQSLKQRHEGGLSGFIHSFVTEVLAIVRSHVSALGGNALVAFFMTECVLNHNLHKNQGQCLINVGGDVVSVSYL